MILGLCQVSYGAEGIATSHIHTRKHCSVFDVSHMMQTEVRGRDRIAFLEGVTTADLINMADNTATLSIFTDPLTGGILDDLIITKTTLGYYYLVSNASRRSHDRKLLKEAQVKRTYFCFVKCGMFYWPERYCNFYEDHKLITRYSILYYFLYVICIFAGHSGHAIWGLGLARLGTGIVVWNSAQAIEDCRRVYVLCCAVYAQALRWAEDCFHMSK